MSVYSSVGRNSLKYVILIRATQYGNTLSVALPSTLKAEFWINDCQLKPFRSSDPTVDSSRRWHHSLACPGTKPPVCWQPQVCSYTPSQKWTQMWQHLGSQLTQYFSFMLVLKKSILNTVAYISDEYYRDVIQLASVTCTCTAIAKPFKFALVLPEVISIHPSFYDLDKDQIILEINNVHETTQLHPLTKRYTPLHLPVWSSGFFMQNQRCYHTSAVVQAGHNKWSKVKHKKKVTDHEKSVTIHKYVTLIASAIKVGGGADPDSNIRLAGIIDSARKAGVPKVNIENAVKKASSKGTDSSSSEFVVYDAQGPSGYHMIIEAFTQNSRKTRPEIKNLLARYSGTLLEPGSSAFMFDHKGVIRVPLYEFDASTDPLEVAIEVGAEDIQRDRDSNSEGASSLDSTTDNEQISEELYVRFLCHPSALTTVSRVLKSLGYTVAGGSLEYIPKSLVHLSQESYDSAVKLVCTLSEHSDVTEVYDNFALQSSLGK